MRCTQDLVLRAFTCLSAYPLRTGNTAIGVVSPAAGAAVYVDTVAGPLNIFGSTFTLGSSAFGSAVYAYNVTGAMNVNGSSFANNVAAGLVRPHCTHIHACPCAFAGLAGCLGLASSTRARVYICVCVCVCLTGWCHSHRGVHRSGVTHSLLLFKQPGCQGK